MIHGLYTSSGFWLSYLNIFNNFRIIAFDINYDKLLKNEYYLSEDIKKLFFIDGKIVGIISHSFGTVISDLIFDYENDKIYKICPIAFSKRIEPNNFLSDILNKTTLSEESIKKNIKLVNTFISQIRDTLNCNGSIYIPIDDCYFSYDVPQKNNIHFAGDHFNIGIALNDIINKSIIIK